MLFSTLCDSLPSTLLLTQWRISELELVVEELRSSEASALAKLNEVLARAEALGFGPALEAAAGASHTDCRRGPFGNNAWDDHSLPSGGQLLSHAAECGNQGLPQSLPRVQEACLRWLASSATLVSEAVDPWRDAAAADPAALLRSLEESRTLVQQQQQVSSASAAVAGAVQMEQMWSCWGAVQKEQGVHAPALLRNSTPDFNCLAGSPHGLSNYRSTGARRTPVFNCLATPSHLHSAGAPHGRVCLPGSGGCRRRCRGAQHGTGGSARGRPAAEAPGRPRLTIDATPAAAAATGKAQRLG